MFTVEVVEDFSTYDEKAYMSESFDFDTITQAYAFLWMNRLKWINPERYSMSIYKDDQLYGIFDDYAQ